MENNKLETERRNIDRYRGLGLRFNVVPGPHGRLEKEAPGLGHADYILR